MIIFSPSFLLHQQWKKGLSCFHDDIVHLLVENCRVDFFDAKNMKFLLSEIVFLAFHFIILILFELWKSCISLMCIINIYDVES